jgi:hypothetical protein
MRESGARWRGRRWVVAFGSALVGGALGCSGAGVSGPVEVATWWGTPGELHGSFAILEQSLRSSSGLDVQLAHHYQDKSRHMTWVDEQLEHANTPPSPVDVFSANNGGDVLRWTPCGASEYHPTTARLLAVDDPAQPSSLEATWIRQTFDDDVLRTLSCDGHIYALPVGIHQVNTLFYNKRLLQQAGYSVDGSAGAPFPTSLAELQVAAEKLEALQGRLHPDALNDSLPPSAFAVAGRDTWTLSEFFIESVMLSAARDASAYEDYWQGHCDAGLVRAALDEVTALKPHFGSWALSWTEARDRVLDGTAALMVMGDWMAADLDPTQVGHAPFPGTNGYFVFTADVFAIPDVTTDPRRCAQSLSARSDGATPLREPKRSLGASPNRRIERGCGQLAGGEGPSRAIRQHSSRLGSKSLRGKTVAIWTLTPRTHPTPTAALEGAELRPPTRWNVGSDRRWRERCRAAVSLRLWLSASSMVRSRWERSGMSTTT